jgi:hypothetical protein
MNLSGPRTQVNIVPATNTITNTITYFVIFDIRYILNAGATCQVNLFNANNQLITTTSCSLTADQYSNWVTDSDFIGFICTNLGFTQSS